MFKPRISRSPRTPGSPEEYTQLKCGFCSLQFHVLVDPDRPTQRVPRLHRVSQLQVKVAEELPESVSITPNEFAAGGFLVAQ